jgi:hypothetical protein
VAENPPLTRDGDSASARFNLAVGVLMELFDADADEASAMLCAKARQMNVHARALAQRILAKPSSAKAIWAAGES